MPINTLLLINEELKKAAAASTMRPAAFFKTTPGSYAAHDQFLGVSVPVIRLIAKKHATLSLHEILKLLSDEYNEKRLLALIILSNQYKKAAPENKQEMYNFYLTNIRFVNNWNLVDSSAHLIIGAHLLNQNKTLLFTLAQSPILWERRIAIIATWQFIRNNHLETTFLLAKLLLTDKEDLIHKAVGWMLREAGKKNTIQLQAFLDAHAQHMPRTMLRYAIEKLPTELRKKYLKK